MGSCCSMGGGHGHREVDVVCGMEVGPNAAEFKSVYGRGRITSAASSARRSSMPSRGSTSNDLAGIRAAFTARALEELAAGR